MNRRGFTIIELTLATLVGSLVLLTALGVFAAMDRGDRILSARAVENIGLEVAAATIENAMSTLVMESGGQVSGGAGAGTAGGAASGSAGGQASGKPRLLLEADLSPGLPGMPEVAQAQAGTAGSAMPLMGVLGPPQRLEVVLARHPIPVDSRPGMPGDEEPGGDKARAVRGVFDLRPEPVRSGERDEMAPRTWTLWWRPMLPGLDESGMPTLVGADDLAVPLARGLVSARWSVFFEETWEAEHSTAAVLDLPAYIKLQITTSAGLEADWLFEIGWTIGPEFAPKAAPTEVAESEEDEDTEGRVGVLRDGAGGEEASPITPRGAPRGRPSGPGTTRRPRQPDMAPGERR